MINPPPPHKWWGHDLLVGPRVKFYMFSNRRLSCFLDSRSNNFLEILMSDLEKSAYSKKVTNLRSQFFGQMRMREISLGLRKKCQKFALSLISLSDLLNNMTERFRNSILNYFNKKTRLCKPFKTQNKGITLAETVQRANCV